MVLNAIRIWRSFRLCWELFRNRRKQFLKTWELGRICCRHFRDCWELLLNYKLRCLQQSSPIGLHGQWWQVGVLWNQAAVRNSPAMAQERISLGTRELWPRSMDPISKVSHGFGGDDALLPQLLCPSGQQVPGDSAHWSPWGHALG